MKDYIVRATAGDGQIRAFAATTGNLVEEARKRHDTSPVATAALGRLLTAGAMMGGMMKNETDVLTLQIKGDGPLGGITVTADAKGDVKGYVDHPEAMMPPKNGKLDVGGAVGIGLLNVIKDMGLKEPYVGQTILQTSEIAEDLTYYFATSEQVPSSVGLGVLMNKDNTVHCAGGFIVQVMRIHIDRIIQSFFFCSFGKSGCYVVVVRTAGIFCANRYHAFGTSEIGSDAAHVNRNHLCCIFGNKTSAVSDFFIYSEKKRNFAGKRNRFIFYAFCQTEKDGSRKLVI